MKTSYRPILWLALGALLVTRALVPTGWMPVADGDGFRIVLCSGQGMVEPEMGPESMHHASMSHEGKSHIGMSHAESSHEDAPAQKDPREHCAYGVLAHAADLPVLPQVEAIAAFQVDPAPVAAMRQLVATLHAPRPPTRGPPALA